MPVLEDIDNLGKRCIFLAEKHEEVVHKISSLSKEELLVIILCLDDKLYSLLTDLLGNLIETSGEEMVRI